MDSMQSFRKLFEYDHWANQAVLASLSSMTGAPEKPLKVFAHVIGAHRVWRARFDEPSAPSVHPWPTLSPDEARLAIEEIHQCWLALLDQFNEEKLDQNLAYRTTQGVPSETPIRDVLTHVLMHAAYHRGQVAAAVREAGGMPATTDYVYYLRQQAQR